MNVKKQFDMPLHYFRGVAILAIVFLHTFVFHYITVPFIALFFNHSSVSSSSTFLILTAGVNVLVCLLLCIGLKKVFHKYSRMIVGC